MKKSGLNTLSHAQKRALFHKHLHENRMDRHTIRDILLKQLDLSRAPADIQDALVSKLGENIVKKITVTVLNGLTEEKRGEFMKLTEEGNEKELRVFIEKHVPDAGAIVADAVAGEIDRFKNLQKEILGS